MARLTNYQMSYLLSMTTHRKFFPVVNWIEQQIEKGTAEPDYGTSCSEVIDEVKVSYGSCEDLDYAVKDGDVLHIELGWVANRYFEDPAEPHKTEIDLLELCEPTHYKWLRLLCMGMEEFFDHPHSCGLDYHIMEDECHCGKHGPVNYYAGNWQYFCGGSPRCCP